MYNGTRFATLYNAMRNLLSIICLFGALSLNACSSSVAGNVFVDQNNNGVVDAGEKGIEGAKYTVSKDGVWYGDGITGPSGHYLLKVKSSGRYCVAVDKAALQGANPAIKPHLSLSPIIDAAIPLPPAPIGKAVTMAKNVGTAAPSDPYAATPVPPKFAISPLNGCVHITAGNEAMDIPAKVDYVSSVASIPTPSTKKLKPGDSYTLKVLYPSSCVLQSFAIPEELLSNDSNVGVLSGNVPMLDLAPGLAPDAEPAPPYDLTQDAVATRTIHLKVRNAIEDDAVTRTIQPIVRCPDQNQYNLPSHAITIAAGNIATVKQNLTTSYQLGQTVVDQITVTNNTTQAMTDAVVTVTFPSAGLNSTIVEAAASGCSNYGQKIVCTLTLNAGESRVLTAQFKVPEKLTTSTLFIVQASLKIPDRTDPILAEDVKFQLP